MAFLSVCCPQCESDQVSKRGKTEQGKQRYQNTTQSASTLENTGGVQSKPIGRYRRALLEPYEAAIKEQLAHSPSLTLKEM